MNERMGRSQDKTMELTRQSVWLRSRYKLKKDRQIFEQTNFPKSQFWSRFAQNTSEPEAPKNYSKELLASFLNPGRDWHAEYIYHSAF